MFKKNLSSLARFKELHGGWGFIQRFDRPDLDPFIYLRASVSAKGPSSAPLAAYLEAVTGFYRNWTGGQRSIEYDLACVRLEYARGLLSYARSHQEPADELAQNVKALTAVVPATLPH